MTITRMIPIVAGFMVLLSVLLTHYIHANWVVLTIFVGINLFQSGITGFCPLATVLKKLGMPEQ
ncbi:YgaP family membrane protein [Magnetococcus sp. PR-3]|uniref:YgaP family membrane protein n=1 Tax=Magnetococcus sp. PR-3 TaxID=3120355 RepID=UPI002FCDE2ED